MNKQLLVDYANLKIQAKQIADQIEFLNPQVLKAVAEIRGENDQPVALGELPGYVFTITKRKTWKYPEAINTADKLLRESKKTAEADGSATYIEKEQLMFLSPKED